MRVGRCRDALGGWSDGSDAEVKLRSQLLEAGWVLLPWYHFRNCITGYPKLRDEEAGERSSTESSKDISDSFALVFQLSNSATTISSSSEVPVSYIDPTILRVKSSTYHVKDRNARNPQRNERN